MAAPRGLAGTAGARRLATLAVLSALMANARAEPFTPLERSTHPPDESGGVLVLTPTFSFDDRGGIVIDLRARTRPAVGWRLQLSLRIDYLDLPLIPARGAGMFAFVGTSTQSLGGFRLHF